MFKTKQTKKKSVLIAGILQPWNHPRMFEKGAKVLQENGWDCTVFGSSGNSNPVKSNGIRVITGDFMVGSWYSRIKAHLKVLRLCFALKPDVLHMHSPDLAWVGALNKIIRKNKYILDLHEDHFDNIKESYKKKIILIRLFKSLIWINEFLFFYFADTIIVAEESYTRILAKYPQKTIVVRNFALPFIPKQGSNSNPDNYILFYGTLSEEWGLFRAIEFWQSLNKYRKTNLVIAGYSAVNNTIGGKILGKVEPENLDSLTLLGVKEFVSPEKIRALISDSLFVLAPYNYAEHISLKVPSKVYETLACNRKIVLPSFFKFLQKSELTQGIIALDFTQNSEEIIKQMLGIIENPDNMKSYVDEQFWNWNTECLKLLDIYKKLS